MTKTFGKNSKAFHQLQFKNQNVTTMFHSSIKYFFKTKNEAAGVC